MEQHDHPPTSDGRDAFARYVAEACIDEANLEIDTTDTTIPHEVRTQKAMDHRDSMLSVLRADLEADIDTYIQDLIEH